MLTNVSEQFIIKDKMSHYVNMSITHKIPCNIILIYITVEFMNSMSG